MKIRLFRYVGKENSRMKRQFIFGGVFATSMALGAGVQTAAQQGQTGTNPQQQQHQQQVTVAGCLQRADDVQGQGSSSASSGQTTQPGQTGQSTTGTGTQAGAQRTETRAGMSGTKFVLTQATMSGTGSHSGTHAGQSGTQAGTQTGTQSGQVGTSGTATGTSGVAASGHVYRLEGGQDQNLERHVNKRVEVRGTIEHRMGAHSGSSTEHAGTSAQPGTAGQSGTASGTQSGTTSGTTSGTQSGTTSGTYTGTQAGMDRQHGDWQNAPQLRVTSVRELEGSCDTQRR